MPQILQRFQKQSTSIKVAKGNASKIQSVDCCSYIWQGSRYVGTHYLVAQAAMPVLLPEHPLWQIAIFTSASAAISVLVWRWLPVIVPD